MLPKIIDPTSLGSLILRPGSVICYIPYVSVRLYLSYPNQRMIIRLKDQ